MSAAAAAAERQAPVRPADKHSAPSRSAASKPLKCQTADYTSLLACASEITSPARIEHVVQYDARTVCLKLRTPDAVEHLHLSWHQTAARICLGPPPSRGATSEAFSFGEVLQSHLRGGILQSVRLPVPWERVVELSVGQRPAEAPSARLFLEVMGRHSNLVLTDGGRSILACGWQVGKGQSSLRQVQVGGAYDLPPPAKGLPPSGQMPESEWRDILTRAAQQVAEGRQGRSSRLSAGLVRAFQGVSPAVVLDLCSIAGVAADGDPTQLTDQQWDSLHAAWQSWLRRVDTSEWAPALTAQQGRYSLLGVGTQREDDGASALIHSYYSSFQGQEASQQLREQVDRALAASKGKLEGKVAAFSKQMHGAQDSLDTQKRADMLMANVHRCKPRAASIDLEDWETGEMVRLQLDPAKSAVQNAEALYKRAGKQRRAVAAVAPLLDAAQAEVEYLEEVELALEQLDSATDFDALQGVKEELVAAGYMRTRSSDAPAALAAKAKSKARKSLKAQRLSAFRQFVSPGGFPVLVGRNNRQNDELTHSIAKPPDLWLHARGVPGAHAILQHPADRSDPPGDDDIQFAADLAAYFSKAREDTRCEVITTSPKHLSRPKGAKPGQVKVSKETVVLANPRRSQAAGEAG